MIQGEIQSNKGQDAKIKELMESFTTVPKYEQLTRELVYLEEATQYFTRIEGLAIATYHWGTQGNPTVLLVHGWAGRGLQLGSFVKALLESGFQVLAFDAPAHGKTEGNKAQFLDFVKVIQHFLEHIQPIYAIIAHSMGAAAATVALSSGAKCEKMVGINSPSRLENGFLRVAEHLKLDRETKLLAKKYFEEKYGSDIWQRTSAVLAAEKLEIPALFFHDKEDKVIPYQEGQELVEAWQNGTFVLTSGLGHSKILSDKNIIQQIIDFIKK